jgi:hypothetical protein
MSGQEGGPRMEQWKDTRFVGVALLAALLIGAGPPVSQPVDLPGPIYTAKVSSRILSPHCSCSGPCQPEEDNGPSLLLEPKACFVWTADSVVLPKRETVMVNHVFAVSQEPGQLMPGDKDFLICPPDVSDASEHLGEGVGGLGLTVEIVPVGPMAAVEKHLGPAKIGFPFGQPALGLPDSAMEGLREKYLNRSAPVGLSLCRYWDVIAPHDFLSGLWRQAEPKPGCVHILYTGEVPSGRKLLGKPPEDAETPKPPSAFNPLVPFGMVCYKSLAEAAEDMAQHEEWERRCQTDFRGIHF